MAELPLEFSNAGILRLTPRRLVVVGVVAVLFSVMAAWAQTERPEPPSPRDFAGVPLLLLVAAGVLLWVRARWRSWSCRLTEDAIILQRAGEVKERIPWGEVREVWSVGPTIVTVSGRRISFPLEQALETLQAMHHERQALSLPVEFGFDRTAWRFMLLLAGIVGALFLGLGLRENWQNQARLLWWPVLLPPLFLGLAGALSWPARQRSYRLDAQGFTRLWQGRKTGRWAWAEFAGYENLRQRFLLQAGGHVRVRLFSRDNLVRFQAALHREAPALPLVRPSPNVEIRSGTLCGVCAANLLFTLTLWWHRPGWLGEALRDCAGPALLTAPVLAYMSVRLLMERRSLALLAATAFSLGALGVWGWFLHLLMASL